MAEARYINRTLLRGLKVLSLFTRDTPTLSLTEITAAASLNKTTAFRIVSTLRSAGYLERHPETRRYRPGLKVMQLGFAAISSLGLRQVARPYLERLSQQVGETVSLGVLDGLEVVYVDRVRNWQPVGIVLGLGSRISAHCASLGKAMLAYLPPEELIRRLDGADLQPCTPNSLVEQSALEADLARVRERGYSINDEEWVLGLRSTAAPILDDNGVAAGAVNISVSAAEISREELEARLSPAVRDTARQISQALGH